MDRLSSAVSAEFAERMNDLGSLTDAEQIAIDCRTREIVQERMVSQQWLDDQMDACDAVYIACKDALPRLMANLDNACLGDGIATSAILAALHQLKRVVKAEAERGASDEAEQS